MFIAQQKSSFCGSNVNTSVSPPKYQLNFLVRILLIAYQMSLQTELRCRRTLNYVKVRSKYFNYQSCRYSYYQCLHTLLFKQEQLVKNIYGFSHVCFVINKCTVTLRKIKYFISFGHE